MTKRKRYNIEVVGATSGHGTPCQVTSSQGTFDQCTMPPQEGLQQLNAIIFNDELDEEEFAEVQVVNVEGIMTYNH